MPLTDFPSARQANTGAVTDQVLVEAPGSGHRIRVRQLYVSADFAVEVKFESGTSTEVWSQFVPASGGSVVPASGSAWFECAEDEDLTFTHAAGGTVTVSVNYEIVRV